MQANRVLVRLNGGKVWAIKQADAEKLTNDERFKYSRDAAGRIVNASFQTDNRASGFTNSRQLSFQQSTGLSGGKAWTLRRPDGSSIS